MSVRSWVVTKLKENLGRHHKNLNDFTFESIDSSGLRIYRPSKSTCIAYCASVSSSSPFTARSLDSAQAELPELQFVVAVPTKIDHSAYAAADQRNVAVEGFSEFASAVRDSDDIGSHRDREQSFLKSRFDSWRVITNFRRTGYRSFTINRSVGRSVSLVTTDSYELTSDAVYGIVESYQGMEIDAIVLTNPSTRGIAPEAIAAAQECDKRLVLISDLPRALRDSWR